MDLEGRLRRSRGRVELELLSLREVMPLVEGGSACGRCRGCLCSFECLMTPSYVLHRVGELESNLEYIDGLLLGMDHEGMHRFYNGVRRGDPRVTVEYPESSEGGVRNG